MKIDIKYHADIDKIEKIECGDWIDLRAAEDVFVPVNELKMISLGVSMRLPEGYEAIVAPRSSTFKRYGIIMANSIGIIDNSYSGTNDVWKFPAYCLMPQDFVVRNNGETVHGTMIKKNERICQFRIQKRMDEVDFNEVDELDEVERGGFGSTGVN